MRKLPRQGIFTSTPTIEYDGSWSISSGSTTKLRIPYTIERLGYLYPTETTRRIVVTTNCQQFFYDAEYPQSAKGATTVEASSLTYDAAKDIYSGTINIGLIYYSGAWTTPLTIPADEASTCKILIQTQTDKWTTAATCRIEFHNYPINQTFYNKTFNLRVTQG